MATIADLLLGSWMSFVWGECVQVYVFEIKSWETRIDFNKLERESRTRTMNFNKVRGKLGSCK